MIEAILHSLERKSKCQADFVNAYNGYVIGEMAHSLYTCLKGGNKVLVCGNGGSAADAVHFASEFTGRFRKDRPPYPVIAFTEPSYLTAVGNDYGFEFVFSRLVEGFGKPGDVLVCLSTSGNSPNVVNAAFAALSKGIEVLAFTGQTGGRLLHHNTRILKVDSTQTDVIQEIHMSVLHTLVEVVEMELAKEQL